MEHGDYFMKAQTKNRGLNSALDVGLSFSLHHWRIIAAITIVPIVLKLSTVLWQNVAPVAAQQLYLIAVINLFADAWMLSVAALLPLRAARGESIPSLPVLGLHAFQFLPKVFISYSLLVLVITSALLLFPLLVFAVFFIWAPFFCVAESLIPVKDSEDEDEHASFDFGDDEEPTRISRAITWISQKSLWELGFARSVHVAGAHISTTLQVVLLMWCFNVVPLALISVLGPTYDTTPVMIAKAIVSSFAMVFMLATAAVVFIASLPEQALTELAIAPNWREQLAGARSPVVRLQNNIRAIVVAVLVAAGATYSLYYSVKASRLPPEGVRASIGSLSWQRNSLRVEFQLQDPSADFRWFSQHGFRLTEPRPVMSDNEPAATTGEVNKSVGGESAAKPQAPAKVWAPTAVTRRLESGIEESLDGGTLSGQSATLVLYAPVPKERAASALELSYVTQFGDVVPLQTLVVPNP